MTYSEREHEFTFAKNDTLMSVTSVDTVSLRYPQVAFICLSESLYDITVLFHQLGLEASQPIQHVKRRSFARKCWLALMLNVGTFQASLNRKMKNSTPCKIVTPKNLNLKLCIRDYVGEATHHANFGSYRYSGGFSPYRRNITTLGLFCQTACVCPVLSCLVLFSPERAQVEPQNRFSRFMAQTTCFRVRKCFMGVERWVTSFGEICPQNPQKWA